MAEPEVEPVMRVTIGDKTHTFWPLRVTPRLAAKIRSQTGETHRTHSARWLQGQADVDTAAALSWIARLQAGEDISYEQVLDEFPDGERQPDIAMEPDSVPIEVDSPE